MEILALSIASNRHSECRRQRSRSVTRTKGIVFRLISPQKPREAAVLLDRVKLVTTTRQDLVSIGLMSNVPDQSIIRRIENVMHRHSQFDRTEARPGVPADLRTSIYDKLPDLISNFLQVLYA